MTATVRALTCPNCGGTIALRAAGSTVSLVCEHCGSTLDATDPELQLVTRADQALRKPAIPLGTRGMLDGTMWEVVGYQERSDGEVAWSEYLLFNPYGGYAFLVDDRRRFSLGRLVTALPDVQLGRLRLAGRRFKQFGEPYPVRTTFVVGEFYWRAQVGETVTETDYVRPGTMLSCEESEAERTWTALEMQGWGVAERAFGLEPRSAGGYGTPSPHEPSPYRQAMRDAWTLAALALAACLVIAIGTAGSARVLQRELQVTPDGRTQTAVLGPIVVPRSEKVRIAAQAGGLDNMWLDLDYSLVDRRTQQSYAAGDTAEYYHGRDSDGSWSEGAYDLVVEASAHKWTDPHAPTAATDPFSIFGTPATAPVEPDPPLPLTVAVDRGGGFAGPFFLAVIAILAWPLIAWLRHQGFETRRNAPVTPVDDEEEDE